MDGAFIPVPGVVFCDHLTVTVPKSCFGEVLPLLESVLDRVLCESPQPGVYLCPAGGWVKTGERSGRVWFQATGGVLAALRHVDAYLAYLSVFSPFPHNVSRLDATLDVEIDPAPVLAGLYVRGRSGELSLTRKRIKPRSVGCRFSPAFYDLSIDTGSVYLGSRTAEVRLVAYDKRQEVHARTREDLGINLLRYELRVTDKMGISLKDAHSPSPVFWHFVSPDILPVPAGVAVWVPFEDGGFDVDRGVVLPYQRLKNRVSSSQELARLFSLADQCGPEGRRLFYGLVRKYHDQAATWADVQGAVLSGDVQPEF
jgi:hypothetical protein